MTTSSNGISEGMHTDSMGVYLRDHISVWVHLGILVVGLITNPLIIIYLNKRRDIGSKF